MSKITLEEPPFLIGNTLEDLILYVKKLVEWTVIVHQDTFGLGAGKKGNLNEDNGVLSVGTSTSDIPEGNNLYYISERARDDIATFIKDGEAITWTHDDSSDTLTGEITKAAAVVEVVAATVTTLIDDTGGTVNATVSSIPAVGGSGASLLQEATINNNFAEVTREINALRVDVETVRVAINLLMANLRAANLQVT